MHFKCVGYVLVNRLRRTGAGNCAPAVRIIITMMSLRAVHAGSGYRYLLRSVATNDAEPDTPEVPDNGDRLSSYYQAKGTPAGRWRGTGLAALNSESAVAGAEITEDQMAALYGEGLHPDADTMIADGASIKDTKLGRSYSIYTNNQPVLQALANAEKQFRSTNDRRPTEAERSTLVQQVGRAHFADAHGGRAPTDGREVVAWVNKIQDNTKQAVAGFDLTFSPVKSVSTLWALADRETANKIAAAHHDAVAESLKWVEDNALFTRVGVNGIQQLKTDGVLASEFTHFDTRGGDPDLHSHVLVSNKVRIADTADAQKVGKVGEWKTIDGQQFFQHMHTASGYYNTALQQRLTDELGLEFTAVATSRNVEPVWEIKGIPTELNERFSSRRALARPVYERMVAEYVDKHKRQPSRRVNYSLWQAAILETRDAKKPADSLDALRSQWRETANEVISEQQIDQLFSTATAQDVTRPVFTDADVQKVSDEAIKATLSRRSSFKRSHIHTAVSQQLRGYRFDSNEQRTAAYASVMEHTIDEQSVCLTPPEFLALPDALTSEVGYGIDRKNNSEIYSTAEQLERERGILAAAEAIAPVFVADTTLAGALQRFTDTHDFTLNAGQVELTRHFLQAGTQVAVAVGPAGTGKTTSMEMVADLWQREGRSVIGLAPSAAAAKVLQADIGTESRTIDSLTYVWDLSADKGLSDVERLDTLPVAIKAGDMLLLDEAGMASTDRIASLVQIATASGAVIRMVGDPAQLDAVETGGIFRTLAKAPGTPMLTDVMRMGDDHEQAAATLAIRDGDVSGLDLYFEREWVADGTHTDMLTAAVEGYLADTASGHRSLVIAPTNADVFTMNEMIQADMLDAGHVSTAGPTVELSDGLTAHIGDTVLARKNKLLGHDNDGVRVLNGQLMTVRAIRADGSIDAFDPRAKTPVHLPADYVASNTQLGYASTVHRSQGATVDTTHSLVDAKLDRNAMYVATTRGKQENRIYVDTSTNLDETAEDAHVHHSGDDDAPTPEQILHGIVHHDHSQLSAVDELESQLTAADSPERIEALYREGVARATSSFSHQVAASLVDSLPAINAAAIETEDDGVEAIENAISHAASRGVDARDFWHDAADDIDFADSPGRLIASRLRNLTDTHLETNERLKGLLGEDADLTTLDADDRHALDAAVHDATRKSIDLDTVWKIVTDGVPADDSAAGVIANNLAELTDQIDNPRDLLDSWIDQLDDSRRVALRRSNFDFVAAADAIEDALRLGLPARQMWVDALAEADWSDTPAGDISEALRQVTQQVRDERLAARASEGDFIDDIAPEAGTAGDGTELPAPPPVIAASDPELAVWLQTSYDELTQDADHHDDSTSPAPDAADAPEGGGPGRGVELKDLTTEEKVALWKSVRPKLGSESGPSGWGTSSPSSPWPTHRHDNGPSW